MVPATAIALLAAANPGLEAPPLHRPPFSWNTLPVFFHSSNTSGPWSPAAVKAIAKFASRNNHLHEQLQAAHEQLAELNRLLGRKQPAGGAAGGGAVATTAAAGGGAPVQQHRAPPKAPPSPATEAKKREATQAALERYGSAEYNASAPPAKSRR